MTVAVIAASLAFAWRLAGEAGAVDPFEAMGVLRPAAREPAPDVEFTTLDRRDGRIRDLQGNPILLGFLTTW